ncbi:MAG: polyphosphate polymerase domain-containing protein [Christensenellales bacterium]|jgi:hypothetical protein
MNKETFRHEHKYVCSQAQIVMFKTRMTGLLKPDIHAGQNGQYNIRSLYFDDVDNTCYFDNENGTDPREKFRIRIYNHDAEYILLELKKKWRGMTQKAACVLTKAQCGILMAGSIPPTDETSPSLLRKLCLLMRTSIMRPVIIVEYNRTPFICGTGNVRITFDQDISSSNYVRGFLNGEIPKRSVMPPGQNILEVKWDEFLPDYIKRNLQTERLQQTAYSKFYICRKFNLDGGGRI